MLDNYFFESMAHYASGMATMSFGMWAAILYKRRKRNRMTFLLFISVAYIALSFLKDIIFLLPPTLFADYKFVEDLVSLFDLSFIPLVCAFFIEITRPGYITNKRLLISYLSFIAFIPVYCLFPSYAVLLCLFLLATIATLVTLAIVPLNVMRYNKYISENYSYTNNISVGWATGCVFAFFVLIVFYELCFYEPTWFSEMVYDICFVTMWNVVCLKSRNHHVVVGMMNFEKAKAEARPLQNGILPTEEADKEQTNNKTVQSPSDSELAKTIFISNSLQRCMDNDKLYLNSRLSLAELALAVGTNKTYISNYINSQGYTFYDYINKYRVEEACRIIDSQTKGEKVSMAEVASLSGFNSATSFNRYFSKIKGVTPTAYSRRQ